MTSSVDGVGVAHLPIRSPDRVNFQEDFSIKHRIKAENDSKVLTITVRDQENYENIETSAIKPSLNAKLVVLGVLCVL